MTAVRQLGRPIADRSLRQAGFVGPPPFGGGCRRGVFTSFQTSVDWRTWDVIVPKEGKNVP
jgi:hypothetical protein